MKNQFPNGRPSKESLNENLKTIAEVDYRRNNQEGSILNLFKGKAMSAIDIIIDKLKKDKDYRGIWKDTVAIAMRDTATKYMKRTEKTSLTEEDMRVIANEGAEFFLELFCNEIKYPDGR